MLHKPILAVAVLALLGVAGCGKDIKDINQRIIDRDYVRMRVPNADYVVDQPDILRIEAQGLPELTRDVQVRQDGYITMPFIQDLKVSKMTPAQIKTTLQEAYAKYYTDPAFTVTVKEYRSKNIFIFGEIYGRQGAISYTGSQTVVDVIGQVGGFTHRAAPSRVRVTRPAADPQEPQVFHVNLNQLLFAGDASQDVLLAENDRIDVPANAFAWLGYQLDNLLWPFRSLFGFFITERAVENAAQ